VAGSHPSGQSARVRTVDRLRGSHRSVHRLSTVLVTVLFGATVSTVATDCNGSPAKQATEPRSTGDVAKPSFLMVWPSSGRRLNGGQLALIDGRVHIDRANKCVVILAPSGSTYPAVWPRATRLRDGFITLASGLSVREGDTVHGSGGYEQLEQVNQIVGSSFTIAAGCQSPTGEVAVFNQGEHVTVR
jgi:hypothetical protein